MVNPTVWGAFGLLNQSRDGSLGGVAGLKISEMLSVLDLMQINNAERRQTVVRQILDMDVFFRNWVAKNKPNA